MHMSNCLKHAAVKDTILTLSCGTSLPFIFIHWITNAPKQRMDPAHNSSAKPPTRVRPNLTHSDVVTGGVSSFSPYSISRSAAFASDMPCVSEQHAVDMTRSANSWQVITATLYIHHAPNTGTLCTKWKAPCTRTTVFVIFCSDWAIAARRRGAPIIWNCTKLILRFITVDVKFPFLSAIVTLKCCKRSPAFAVITITCHKYDMINYIYVRLKADEQPA